MKEAQSWVNAFKLAMLMKDELEDDLLMRRSMLAENIGHELNLINDISAATNVQNINENSKENVQLDSTLTHKKKSKSVRLGNTSNNTTSNNATSNNTTSTSQSSAEITVVKPKTLISVLLTVFIEIKQYVDENPNIKHCQWLLLFSPLFPLLLPCDMQVPVLIFMLYIGVGYYFCESQIKKLWLLQF
jgi:hypothetical protein